MDISLDGKLVAIGTRDGGADEVTVSFRDVDSGKDLADRLPSMRFYTLAITPDHKGVYYSKFTPEGPRVLHHVDGHRRWRRTGRSSARATAPTSS